MEAQKWVVEMKIDQLKLAIKNLGKPNMQVIRISSHDNGMSDALGSGEYIELSNEPQVVAGILNVLMDRLKVQEDILAGMNKLQLSDDAISKIKEVIDTSIRESLQAVDWQERSTYGVTDAISDALNDSTDKLKEL